MVDSQHNAPFPVISQKASSPRHRVTSPKGRRIVAQQRELIVREKKAGRDTTLSEGLLSQFERTLAIFEADLRAIQENGK